MDDDLYNVFLNNSHTTKQEKMLIDYNYNVLQYIFSKMDKINKKIEILELGVGKGYFAQACILHNSKNKSSIMYSAFDRNKEMLKNLSNFDKNIKTYKGELPDLPIKEKKFDIVYCAFVVEHLNNGLEVYDLIRNIKSVLNKGGLIVFLTPNALSQKFEFFNIDYTHHYPTTPRNVTMAFNDCSLTDVFVQKFNGLCTYKRFNWPLIRLIHKLVFKFYNYRALSILFWPVYRKPLYSLDNFFYKVFCFFKEENLIFIAKNNK